MTKHLTRRPPFAFNPTELLRVSIYTVAKSTVALAVLIAIRSVGIDLTALGVLGGAIAWVSASASRRSSAI